MGHRQQEMSTIYRGSFAPIKTYVDQAWLDELNVKSRQHIISAHRCALIRIIKAHTISTDALEIIANVQQYTNWKIKVLHNTPKPLFNLWYWYNDKLDKNNFINQLKANLIAKWQSAWHNSSKERIAFDFFPNVQNRITKTWIVPSYVSHKRLQATGTSKST